MKRIKTKIICAVIVMVLTVLMAAPVLAADVNAYAVLTEDGILVFLQSEMTLQNDTVYGSVTTVNGITYTDVRVFTGVENTGNTVPWNSYKSSITDVYVSPGCTIKPASARYWFDSCSKLKYFYGDGFDFRETTSINHMFAYCTALETIKLSGSFDALKDMTYLFNGDKNLVSADLSEFYTTSNLQNMDCAFYDCESLQSESLDFSHVTTSGVSGMSYLFNGCKSLTSLDLSMFDTRNVNTMRCMFYFCENLETLDVSSFRTPNVIAMEFMFGYCRKLKAVDVSRWDTAKVRNMQDMFGECASLKTVDVSGFKTSEVTCMSGMFAGCTLLETVDVSGFDTSNVTQMYGMFFRDVNLTALDVSGFDVSKVDNQYGLELMFLDCGRLEDLDVSKWDTSAVKSLYGIFLDCANLKSLDVSGWKTPNVTTMEGAFGGCEQLTSLDLSGWDTSKVTTMRDMFSGCCALEELDISGFDTSGLAEDGTHGIFYRNDALKKLVLSPNFREWSEDAELPAGTWTDGIRFLSEEELRTNYPANAAEWAGTWILYDGTPLPMSEAVIEPIPDQEYTGSAVKPAVTVTYNGKELTKGTHYTVSYDNNVEVGTATATVTGKGYYAGTISADFNIVIFPTVPVLTGIVNEEAGITITWDPAAKATKYKIYRKEGSGSFKELKEVTELTCTDKKANKMGTKYTYRVKAYADGKWTDYSNKLALVRNPFADVSASDDSFQYIAWAYNNSVVKGSVESDGNRYFNPNGSTTRMNFVMILWKMHGQPAVSGSNPFTDVTGSTSIKAVKWAVKKGLVTGTSATTFSPEDNLSRMNIIMILYKLAGSPKSSTTTAFEDISGSKTIKAVNWAVKKGIIAGVDETHFDPNGECSRALLVEVLYKYNELYPIM